MYDYNKEKEEKKRRNFSIFLRLIAVMLLCAVGSFASGEAGLKGTSSFLLVLAIAMFFVVVVAAFWLDSEEKKY